jgi:3-hydroxymyristoyl/3-hydroxydecanoyl-(acyl carrier protein) dehydratase
MTAATAANAVTEPVICAVRRSGSALELSFRAPDSLLYFDGHFPRFPILPGVVQVDWAIRLGRRHLALDASPARTVQVKFRKPIHPDAELTLTLKLADDGHRLAFEYRDAQEIYSSGQIGF